MIGRLTGKILEKHPPVLLLDVHGVGYELHASMNTFYKLPAAGEEATLHTHLVVREDAQLLYGFFELRERMLFRVLIKISGVGPKMALAILSSMDPDAFAACVANSDVSSLVRVPGVGKKTAERLIVDMRDRVDSWDMGTVAPMTASVVDTPGQAKHDAISALIALGYKAQEASRLVTRVYTEDATSEALIRAALRQSA